MSTPEPPPFVAATADQIVQSLGSPQWEVRHEAASRLRALGHAALDALIAGMSHPNWRVRHGCADLMDHLADQRCTEPLLRLLNDPVESVRRLALHALGCQRCKACPLDTDVVALLIERIQRDSSIRVRRVAVHMLGCQPADDRARHLLESLLHNETDPKLLARARWSLAQHTG
jgi:HEAT repeat protein